ncbi:hypothetical protein FRZ67_20730 [Panacibacter ginsenosidivorans]|uniref:UspA domain-containing protein n=1 Tax=Panacibacter ginsenosidivorans TaxID=1813871 RepID=A0A5B8VDJ7_9BACT|nr:universal stress protein [Panacibacter ginsenosidivorans]QEC69607.1 hypothetical protein FRZ67_20730 [Panacibacter ginsenosidivorans]
MSRVIVVTNFSDSSRNALKYACEFLNIPQTQVLLLNIFGFPGSLSGDAIAIAAMSETITNDERLLQKEYAWVKENYSNINIAREMVTGSFIEVLHEFEKDPETSLIIMGAGGNYNDLLSWDTNIIDAFVDLTISVLVVPASVQYKPVNKIAFACNYYRKNLHTPVSMIRKLIQFTRAKLYVINVVSHDETIDEEAIKSKHLLQRSLEDISPTYYEPAFENIFTAIDQFTSAENIDMLIVIPTRHGIWYNIFHHNHTKGLVHLNHIPLLSLRQRERFI